MYLNDGGNPAKEEDDMHPYGLSRRDAGDLDVAGIKENGRATRYGHVPGTGGDTRAQQRSAGKRAARRRIKHVERARARREIEDSTSNH